VEGMNPWRFGLSAATGLEPPEKLFAKSGRQLAGWRAQLPMFAPVIRAKYAPGAAALGVYSNREIVDLYGQVLKTMKPRMHCAAERKVCNRPTQLQAMRRR
jgi:hypothetical protein